MNTKQADTLGDTAIAVAALVAANDFEAASDLGGPLAAGAAYVMLSGILGALAAHDGTTLDLDALAAGFRNAAIDRASVTATETGTLSEPNPEP